MAAKWTEDKDLEIGLLVAVVDQDHPLTLGTLIDMMMSFPRMQRY